MNLDELRTVQSKERRKDSLQHLRDSFYGDVADYIADLKAERKDAAAQADDPFSSPEVSRLTDEIETAEEVVEAVYERRVGKVVKLASFAAADMPVDEDGMTGEEKALFEDLVSRIEHNKSNVLDLLAGERRPEAADGSEASATTETDERETKAASTDADTDADADAERASGVLADAMGSGSDDSEREDRPDSRGNDGSGHTPVDPEPAPPGVGASDDTAATVSTPNATERGTVEGGATTDATAETSDADPTQRTEADVDTAPADEVDDHDRVTVRITSDIGEIFGVDEREYDLTTEDVVTLPTANAEPLIEHEAAERLD